MDFISGSNGSVGGRRSEYSSPVGCWRLHSTIVKMPRGWPCWNRCLTRVFTLKRLILSALTKQRAKGNLARRQSSMTSSTSAANVPKSPRRQLGPHAARGAGRCASIFKGMLENHARAGLPAADLQVIRRGKALEYFSRHYGKVYVDEGRPISVKDALVGINQLIDEDANKTSEPPPVTAEPITRQFLRIFDGKTELARDQMQKLLARLGHRAGRIHEPRLDG